MHGQTPRAHRMLVDAYRVVHRRMRMRNLAAVLTLLAGGARASAAEVYADPAELPNTRAGTQDLVMVYYHDDTNPDMYTAAGPYGYATRYEELQAAADYLRRFIATQSGGMMDLDITFVDVGIGLQSDGVSKWSANDTLDPYGDLNQTYAPGLVATLDDYKYVVSNLADVSGNVMTFPAGAAGIGWIGNGSSQQSLWVSYDSFGVLYHEFGHNLGVGHANALDVNAAAYTYDFATGTYAVSPSTGPAWDQPLASLPIGTHVVGYGSPYDLMGAGDGPYNPLTKRKFGWLGSQHFADIGAVAPAGSVDLDLRIYDHSDLRLVSTGSGPTLRYGVQQGYQDVAYDATIHRVGQQFNTTTHKWEPVLQRLDFYYQGADSAYMTQSYLPSQQNANDPHGIVVMLDGRYVGTLQDAQTINERDVDALIANLDEGDDYLAMAHDDPRDPRRLRHTWYQLTFNGTGEDADGTYANLRITTSTGLQVGGYQWDADAGVAGAQDGAGTGIWQVGVGNWYDASAGTGNHAWADGQDATFGAGGTAATVALGGDVSAASLNFAPTGSGQYTLTGGAGDHTLSIGTWGMTAAESATLDVRIALDADQFWSIAGGKEIAVGGAITANGHRLTKLGQGTLSLQSVNTWGDDSLHVAEGTLRQDATQTLAAAEQAITIEEGATYQVSGGTLLINKSTDFYPTPKVTGNGTLRLSRTDSSLLSQEVVFFAGGGGGQSSCTVDSAVLLDAGLHHIGSSGNGGWNAYDNADGMYASGPATFAGDIRGDGGLVYHALAAGAQLVLSGDNTFTGEIVLERGSLHLVGEGALQGANRLTFSVAAGDTARLFLRGADRTVSDLSSSGLGTAQIANSTGATSFIGWRATPGAATLTVQQDNAGVFGGTIQDTLAEAGGSGTAGALGLTKTGGADLTLSGANTYSGATTVGAGRLVLDYTGGSNRLYNGSSAGALVMTGGEVVFDNLGANTQVFATTTLLSGTANKLTLGAGRTTGTVDFGTLGWTAGAVDFSDIGVTPGWALASGDANSALLLPGAVTANGGVNVVATDSQGYLIIGSTTDYSQGGAIVAESGAAIRLIETGIGGNLADTPVTLAAAGVTDVGSIYNAYTTFNSTDTVTLDIGAGNTLRLGANGGIAAASGTHLALTGGTLSAGGADNTAGSLTFNATDDISVSSQITDNGTGQVALRKIGAGTLTLSSANTYTGATALDAGILLIGADQALGSGSAVTVAAPATLDLADHALDIGSLAGAGAVALGTAGTLTVGGDGTDTLYAGAMTGSGTSRLVKEGAGAMTLSGASGFDTLSLVDDGMLKVAASGSLTLANGGTVAQTAGFELDGAFAGDLLVDGALTGNGGNFTGGTVTISATGVLSPGGAGAAGTLSFDNLTIASGGVYAVDLMTDSSYDRITVNGTGQLDGQFLQVNLDAGWVAAAGQSYAVVSGAAITGSPGQILPALPAGLAWEVVYDGAAYRLNVVQGAPGEGGDATPQQVEGIRALNAVNLTDPDLLLAFQQVASLGADRAAQLAAVDRLMGSAHVAATHAAAWAGSQRTLETLLHLARPPAPSSGQANAWPALRATALEDIEAEDPNGEPVGVFGQVNYLSMDKGQSDMGAAAIDATGEGVSAGVDLRFSESCNAGVMFAYDHVQADAGGGLGEAEVDLFTVAGFARSRINRRWFADGVFGLAIVENDTERRGLPGDLTAKGSNDGYQWTAAAKFGYLAMADESKWELTPYGQLQAVGTHMGAYTETGAGGAGLSYASSDDTTWLSTLGVDAARTWTLDSGWSIRAGVGLGWIHRLSDDGASVQTSFIGDPSVSFKTFAQAFDEDSVQGSLRLDVKAPASWTFYFEGVASQGLGDTESSQFSANAGARYDF